MNYASYRLEDTINTEQGVQPFVPAARDHESQYSAMYLYTGKLSRGLAHYEWFWTQQPCCCGPIIASARNPPQRRASSPGRLSLRTELATRVEGSTAKIRRIPSRLGSGTRTALEATIKKWVVKGISQRIIHPILSTKPGVPQELLALGVSRRCLQFGKEVRFATETSSSWSTIVNTTAKAHTCTGSTCRVGIAKNSGVLSACSQAPHVADL